MREQKHGVLGAFAAALAVAATACSSPSSTAGAGAGSTTATHEVVSSTATTKPGAGGGHAGGGGAGGGATFGASVLMHHNHPSRDGMYADPAFTKAAASGLHRDTSFTGVLDGDVYAQLLYWDAQGDGPDLVVGATESNNVMALDADTGALVWKANLGPEVPVSFFGCGNIDPYGITGTPVIDYATRTLYVDGTVAVGGLPSHRIYALSMDDGSVRDGWPVVVEDALSGFAGHGFDSRYQGERGALLLVSGNLYVAFGGLYGDCGAYWGWLVSVSTTDPTKVHAWATDARGGGAWASGGPASDGTSLFVTTGNTFATDVWAGGDAIIKLTPSLAFNREFFAPTNWKDLDAADIDLGGSGALLLDLDSGSPNQLAVALGKSGDAFVIDRDHPGGIGGQLATAHVADSAIINAATAYTTRRGTYVAFKGAGAACGGPSGDLVAIQVSAHAVATAWCAAQQGAGSPIVTTTDGTENAIVWGVGAEGDGRLHGFDGDTGAIVFGGGGPAEQMSSLRRFISPIVAKGRMFVGGDGAVYAFKP